MKTILKVLKNLFEVNPNKTEININDAFFKSEEYLREKEFYRNRSYLAILIA